MSGTLPAQPDRVWSNPSVLAFSGERDPLAAARQEAELLHAAAVSAGAAGPPVDIFALAAHLGIPLTPRDDLIDAQIRPGDDGLTIEYNPSRPRGRLRFSIAHELAHSRFSDVADKPRHRTAAGSVQISPDADDWELELVCDVIASELLMPQSVVAGLVTIDPDIDFLMENRRQLDVSTEALLRRVVGGATRPLMLVALSRPGDTAGDLLRVDYVDAAVPAPSLPTLQHGERVHGLGVAADCSAVGQTVRGDAMVKGVAVRVQAVGVPPYPGRRWPRILALLEPTSSTPPAEGIEFVTGDIIDAATGPDPVIIAHVVPDSTRGWSRFGAGGALARAFPLSASSYRGWVLSAAAQRALGNVHFTDPPLQGPPVTIASIVAQAGFGPSSQPRLDYAALSSGIAKVAARASEKSAVVHVPRLGAGQAGGRWDLIQDILREQLVERGIRVVVHTLPSTGNTR